MTISSVMHKLIKYIVSSNITDLIPYFQIEKITKPIFYVRVFFL